MTEDGDSMMSNSISLSDSANSNNKQTSPQRSHKSKESSSVDLSALSGASPTKTKPSPGRLNSKKIVNAQIETIIENVDEHGTNSDASHEQETD